MTNPSFEPVKALTSYSPPNIRIPDDWKEAKIILEERIIKDAEATNAREVAQYVEDEIVTGQQWFTPGDANKFRQTFRKVIDLGGLVNFPAELPVANELKVAHGLPASSTGFVVTKITGSASDGGTMYIPLPNVSTALGNIDLCMDATHIILTSTGNYSAFETACIIIEYVRE